MCKFTTRDNLLTILYMTTNLHNYCIRYFWYKTVMLTHSELFTVEVFLFADSVGCVCVSASPCSGCVSWPSIRPSIFWTSSPHPVSGATTTLSCPGTTAPSIASHPTEKSMSDLDTVILTVCTLDVYFSGVGILKFVVLFYFCSKTKGSCKSYVDTCHTSDKGKGRGSPALANSPAPRPQSSKKGSSVTPSQTQKKHKVSLYYTKYKSSSSPAMAGALTVDEEQEDLTPDLPLTPDPDVCNNNEPVFISELDKKTTTDVKENPHSTVEDRVPAAVMFPMEMPAGFPDNVILSPGPRPGLLVCSPVEKSCTEHYAEKVDPDKRDTSETEVRRAFNSVIHFIYSLPTM